MLFHVTQGAFLPHVTVCSAEVWSVAYVVSSVVLGTDSPALAEVTVAGDGLRLSKQNCSCALLSMVVHTWNGSTLGAEVGRYQLESGVANLLSQK